MKSVGDLSEDELIATYFQPIAGDLRNDTASVAFSPGHEILVSADSLIEDVHFLRRTPSAWVGYKSVLVNASDIVADGGRPRYMTLALGLPARLPCEWLKGFVQGLGEGLRATDVTLIGGDTTRTPWGIAISITVLGEVAHGQRITRGGARPGDLIAVTGVLGDASIGLEVLLERRKFAPDQAEYWLRRHSFPPFRGGFARQLAAAGLATAMMDLSDGLAIDLSRLCQASKVAAQIDLDLLPLSASARALGMSPHQAVLGGEDYELLLTLPAQHLKQLETIGRDSQVPITRIGQVGSGAGVVWRVQGAEVNLEGDGWHHFS